MRAITLFTTVALLSVAASSLIGCGGGPDPLIGKWNMQDKSLPKDSKVDIEFTADKKMHLAMNVKGGSTELDVTADGNYTHEGNKFKMTIESVKIDTSKLPKAQQGSTKMIEENMKKELNKHQEGEMIITGDTGVWKTGKGSSSLTRLK